MEEAISYQQDVLSGQLATYGTGFDDIDSGPSLDYMVEHREDPSVKPLFEKFFLHAPEFHLYDVSKDMACLNNLADDPNHKEVRDRLQTKLTERLKADKDPRVTGEGDIWETYERFGGLRWYPKPQWAEDNPKDVPHQPWVEKRRPGKR